MNMYILITKAVKNEYEEAISKSYKFTGLKFFAFNNFTLFQISTMLRAGRMK